MKTLILVLTATFCTTVASAQSKLKLEGIYARIDDTLELKGGEPSGYSKELAAE